MDQRLLGLDALRGLAAIVVVLFHLGLPIHGAHLAVDFFFMLSGFVMARTYESRLRDGSLGGWRFFAKRYQRLWGWMALGTSLGLLAALGRYGFSGELGLAYVLMLAMLPAFNVAAAPYLLNLPLWSIVYELVANAVHGLGLARLGKRGLLLVAVLCALGLGWAIALAGFPRGGFAEYHWLVLLRVGTAYTLGILIYRLWGDSPPVRVPFAAAFLALPAYVLAVWIWPWEWAPLAFILLLAPLMMFGGMAARFDSAKVQEAATMLGAISFPLYAVHFPAIQLLQLSWGPAALAGIGLAVWLWQRRVLPHSIIRMMAKARPVPARNSVQLQ
ncbi:acyltransferase [Aurantiacibacter sp. MUD11]|uniref:acyltransferase family protein n=1 Tax=Aurantiacibacter sp. MUD11 TaxID=3003265 RepID=UPI0022AB4B44|nr:acyltransferase [Aurantiacibacter sp. MUD11]WAT16918.1 acyltransferase [Aurantiacibacter sp. MUD11]